MSKYYLTKNTAKPVTINGRTFQFQACDYFEPTHSWWGTYKADSAQDITDLDAAVEAGLATLITADDYAVYEVKKKTARVSKNFIDFGVKHSPQFGPSSGKPVEVVEEPQPAKAEVSNESLDEVIAPRPERKGRK